MTSAVPDTLTRSRFPRGRRLSAVVPLALVTVLAASACGAAPAPGAAAGGGTAPASLTYLNTLPIESLTYATELVADTMGYFKAEGVDVNFQFVNGTPPAIAAVMSNQGVLTRAGDTDVIKSIVTKDAQVVNVGAVQKGGTTIRVVSSKRNPIAKPADLRGKVIGESALGGTTEGILTLVLNSVGMKITDVKQQVVGLSAGVFNLVQDGRIDGYMTSLDTALQLRAGQPDAIILDPSQFIASGSQDYVTSSAQAKDPVKQDAIRRYLKAIKSAITFMAKDQATGFAETIKSISGKYKVPAFADKDVTKAALDGYLASWTSGGLDKAVQVDAAKWAATYDEMVKADVVPGGKDPKAWIDDQLAPKS
jgi:NitT/TauT family transport system substrate-binding protein